MAKLSNRWKILIAFGIGVIATGTFNLLSEPLVTANITDEMLDARSDGIISAQQKEITRLREIIQRLSRESGIEVTDKELKGTITCTTHNDCPSIASVCSENTCQPLKNPKCSCGANNQYVICISQNGTGNEARTVDCGDGVCTDDGAPRCI